VESVPKARATFVFWITGLGALPYTDKVTKLINKIGVSSFPLNRAIQNASLDINGLRLTTNIAEQVDVRISNMSATDLALMSQASETDDYSLFDSTRINDMLRTGGDAIQANTTRGLGANYTFSVVDSGVLADERLALTITLEEALLMDGFQTHAPRDAQPFKNINKFMLDLNFQDITDSVINLAPIAGVSVALQSAQHSLLVRTWTPSIVEKIPPTLVYNSPVYLRQQGANVTAIGTAVVPVNIPTFSVNGIPSMFAVYCRRPKVQYGAVTFNPIVGMSIDMDNRQNIFQTMDVHQLYTMSTQNGYNKRFATWAGARASVDPTKYNPGAGGIFYFTPSQMGLTEGTLANVNKTLSMTVRMLVQSELGVGVTENCIADAWAIYDDFVVDNNGTFTNFRPSLTPEQALSSPIQYSVEDTSSTNRVLGGSWFSRLYKALTHPVTRYASKAVRNAPGLSSHVGDETSFGRFALSHGYGKNTRTTKPKAKAKGGALVRLGGKKMTKAELDAMLR
jgi:hypothetical protein